MGVHNRPRCLITVRGELLGDRYLKSDTVTYSVLPNEEVPRYTKVYIQLMNVGYVYAIVNWVRAQDCTS